MFAFITTFFGNTRMSLKTDDFGVNSSAKFPYRTKTKQNEPKKQERKSLIKTGKIAQSPCFFVFLTEKQMPES